MDKRPPLPPSERDFEAYRLVRIEQQSTRQAAELLGVSQTRIVQVLERVTAFLVEAALDDLQDKARQGQRLHVAQQLAAERVDFLFGQAVGSYRQSQGTQRTVREVNAAGRPTVTITTTREGFGEPRYLAAAARLAICGAKLPVSMLFNSLPEDVDEGEAASPPKEDCSTSSPEQALASAVQAAAKSTSLIEKTTCVSIAAAHSQPQAFSPALVQHPDSAGPLTERQRRARQVFFTRAS